MSLLSSAQHFSAQEVARTLVRPVVRLSREISPRLELFQQRGRGPLAVFLPAYGPEGAALLRIYYMASALRSLGWRTLVLSWKLTLHQRRRMLAAAKPDVLVMQGARHPLNQPEFYPGQRIIYDMDDADFHLGHLADRVQRAMPKVTAVVSGSAYISDWCRRAGAPASHVIWTGSPMSSRPRQPQATRPPVVAWSQTRPMDYIHEAEMVRQVMRRLAARVQGVTLRLFDRQDGDDPAFADTFQAPGLSVEWRTKCCYRDYLRLFDDVALGLAPLGSESHFTRGKSFGKVLAYLDRGVPIIASDACENSAVLDETSSVVSNDLDYWVCAGENLLKNAQARQAMADAGNRQFRKHLTLSVAAERLDGVLRKYIP